MQIIKSMGKRLGLDKEELKEIGTHFMRKTFAKYAYEITRKDMRKVQQLLGHSSVEVTQRYLPNTQEELDEVIDKMADVL